MLGQGARATLQALWHFLHDLEGSVGIYAAFPSPKPAEMAGGSSPSGILSLLPPALTLFNLHYDWQPFLAFLRFGFFLTPSFNENGLHTFAFLFLLLGDDS